MAYVFDNINSSLSPEQENQGSNVFGNQPAAQGADGQNSQQGTVQKTDSSTDIGGGGGGSSGGKVTGGGSAQVQQKSQQNYQARNPLKEIYKRNQAADVSAPNTEGIKQQIGQSVAAAQDEANKYYDQAKQVQHVSEEDVSGIKKGEENAFKNINTVITPQAAAVDQFALKSQAAPQSAYDIQTLTGLRDYLKGSRQGDTRGTASLDTSFLTKNQDFQKTRAAIKNEAEQAKAARANLENTATETARTERQKAIDAAREEGLGRLGTEAKTYEDPAAQRLAEEQAMRAGLAQNYKDNNLDAMAKNAARARAKELAGGDAVKEQLLLNMIEGKGYAGNQGIEAFNKIAKQDLVDPNYSGLSGAFGVNDLPQGTSLASFMDTPQQQEYANIMKALGKSVAGPQAINPALRVDQSKLDNFFNQGLSAYSKANEGNKQYQALADKFNEQLNLTNKDVAEANTKDQAEYDKMIPNLERFNQAKELLKSNNTQDSAKATKIVPMMKNESSDEYLDRVLRIADDLYWTSQNTAARISQRTEAARKQLEQAANENFGLYDFNIINDYLNTARNFTPTLNPGFQGIAG